MHHREQHEEIIHQLVQILGTEHGVRAGKISPTSTIHGDLGVDGADAWDFILQIERHWNISLNLKLENHFGMESGLFQTDPPSPLKMGDLAELTLDAIESKREN